MSRLTDALRVLLGKCTPAGTQPVGDKVDDLIECLAGNYNGTRTVFFGNSSDNLLYKDEAMTVKAEKDEVEYAFIHGSIYIRLPNSKAHWSANNVQVLDDTVYVYVIYVADGNFSQLSFRAQK